MGSTKNVRRPYIITLDCKERQLNEKITEFLTNKPQYKLLNVALAAPGSRIHFVAVFIKKGGA